MVEKMMAIRPKRPGTTSAPIKIDINAAPMAPFFKGSSVQRRSMAPISTHLLARCSCILKHTVTLW